MTEQVRKPHPEEETPVEETEAPEAPEVRTDDLDDLLDEIDDVLEENAEEFVRNYVQKGGQ
jgi:ubiquitin-like protein Pup